MLDIHSTVVQHGDQSLSVMEQWLPSLLAYDAMPCSRPYYAVLHYADRCFSCWLKQGLQLDVPYTDGVVMSLSVACSAAKINAYSDNSPSCTVRLGLSLLLSLASQQHAIFHFVDVGYAVTLSAPSWKAALAGYACVCLTYTARG